MGWTLLQNIRDRAHARASHGRGSPLPQQRPQFQASRRPPQPAPLTCSVPDCIWDGTGVMEWGPKTSGSVTNTKHCPSCLLGPWNSPQTLNPRHHPKLSNQSFLPLGSAVRIHAHAHARCPSPRADTSVGLAWANERWLAGWLACWNKSCPAASRPRPCAVLWPRRHVCTCWGRGAWPGRESTSRVPGLLVKPRAAEVYLRPSNLGGPRGWALRLASHSVAPHSTASCHSAPCRGCAAALRARVLYEYIHETDSRHDGRRTLTFSEHGTVYHSTPGLALSASSACLPALHTLIHSQLRCLHVLPVGPSQ